MSGPKPIRKPTSGPERDRAQRGNYLVTICTEGRAARFGSTEGGRMHLNEAGLMVEGCWRDAGDRFANVAIDASVVMPDHTHAIVGVGAERTSDVRPHGALPDVVRVFKSTSTLAYIRGVRERGWPPFCRRLWQRGYHDRRLRTPREVSVARDYVRSNPIR